MLRALARLGVVHAPEFTEQMLAALGDAQERLVLVRDPAAVGRSLRLLALTLGASEETADELVWRFWAEAEDEASDATAAPLRP